jgi:hypothetical protein
LRDCDGVGRVSRVLGQAILRTAGAGAVAAGPVPRLSDDRGREVLHAGVVPP